MQFKGWKAYAGGIGQILVGVGLLYLGTQPRFGGETQIALVSGGLYAISTGLGTIGIRDKQRRIGEKLDEGCA